MNPRARALDLAIPVASCAAAGFGTGHLTDTLTRDELTALLEIFAVVAAGDPVRLRTVVAASDGMTAPMLPAREEERLRKAHAAFTRLKRANLPVPLELQAANGRYVAMVRAARVERGKAAGRRRAA